MDDEPWHVRRARELKAAAPAVKRKKWRRQFINVPWAWAERLQSAKRVSTYRLALALLYEHWKTGGKPVALTNAFALTEGLSQRSKWRAIGELETLNLIQVERCRRRSPRVVLELMSRGQT